MANFIVNTVRAWSWRLALALLIPCSILSAQSQRVDSGFVQITVQDSMGMVDGFQIQSGGQRATTNAAGVAHLRLPVGRQLITVRRLGFRPTSASVLVAADREISVMIPVVMQGAMQMADVRVSATRTEKLSGETPIRVEVVDEMEVDENTLMSPSGIGMLLNETPGVRVFQSAPGLGTGSVRILGLPGQYTVMLADGLPLYGGSASALGPLDISPVDLQRVEIIKGAASALYGGQSLGGVVNLVSKVPTGRSEVLLNRRMFGVSDVATWLSHRFTPHVGLSLLASGTSQSVWDIDHDGWADQPEATRWNLRPRFTAVDARGRALFVTAGYGVDDRTGGTMAGARAPDGAPFRDGLQSTRADLGITASAPTSDGGKLATRFALSTSERRRTFGVGPVERERITTGFAEVTRSFEGARSATVLGGAVQQDVFSNDLNRRYDHSWITPGLFVTTERDIGRITISASARADAHPDAGVQVTERLAILTRPVDGWTVRASVGTGFAAQSPVTEETEAIGLRRIAGGAPLSTEKSVGVMLDIGGTLLGAEVLVSAYGSRIANAVQLMDGPVGGMPPMLRNARDDVRISGVEAVALWRFEGGKFIGSYGFSNGSRPDPMTGLRVPTPMIPRHRLGGDLMMEKEGVYRWGLEGTWFAEQPLDDSPFRSASKPYVYTMAIVARQFGSTEIVLNCENLLNVRQTDSDRLVRPTPLSSGRWTTGVWAPLEGFMANVAVRYRWGTR